MDATSGKSAIIVFYACWPPSKSGCGTQERPGIDLDRSYAPLATDQAIKLILCLVAAKGLKIRQFDVVTAYLNAEPSDRKVFMNDEQNPLVSKAYLGRCLTIPNRS